MSKNFTKDLNKVLNTSKSRGINSLIPEEEPEHNPQKTIKPSKNIRTSYIIEEETLNKIKNIAYWDRLTVTDIINKSLKDYIKRYENEKGNILERKK